MNKNKTYLLIFNLILFSLSAQSTIIYVNWTANGLNDGSNWENAFTDLQVALQTAEYDDEIWVAKGTYYPTDSLDRSIYFQLKSGVKLYGGFEGFEDSIDQRDFKNNRTILSGDIGERGNHTDNSYTVLYSEYGDVTTTVDGLTITFGNADKLGESDLAIILVVEEYTYLEQLRVKKRISL